MDSDRHDHTVEVGEQLVGVVLFRPDWGRRLETKPQEIIRRSAKERSPKHAKRQKKKTKQATNQPAS